MSKTPHRFFFLLVCWAAFPCLPVAAENPHKFALGAMPYGGQVHWGFAPKWALEVRAMTGEQSSTEGTISAQVIGLRVVRYFRAPTRVRFFMGVEGASTHSNSDRSEYRTTGFAAGGFAGSEIYLLKRLSVGVDIGPYLLSTKVQKTETSDSDVSIVINSFMNFYFL